MLTEEIDVEGRIIEYQATRWDKGAIVLLGKAWRVKENIYQCLAIVGDSLCRIEISAHEETAFEHDCV